MANTLGDVASIDNFGSKLSKWDPEGNSLFALVDMGSNGIRFSISDLSAPQSRLLHSVYAERAAISLYDALHDSRPDSKDFHFSLETISAVASTLCRFRTICDGFGVPKEQISVFATEAMRTSVNRDEMLEAIMNESGLNVLILNPSMESLFGAMGARTGFNHVDGLFMDLGGGSVQMTYMNSTTKDYDILAAEAAHSMPYGAAKVSAAIMTPNAPAMRSDLQGLMKKAFESLKARFPKLAMDEAAEGITIYFCGGGFRGYGSMLMQTHDIQPYPIPIIGGFTVPGSKFVKWEDMLAENENFKGKIYGLSKRRRQQFGAIVTVVESLVKVVPKIKQVVFCAGGNREGVLYVKLPENIRQTPPISLLPGVSSNINPDFVSEAQMLISKALPESCPKIFTQELQEYVIRNAWIDLGDPDSINSIRALQNPISGPISGLPGLTHEIRAILALTMCARWGADIDSSAQPLYENLRKLIGPALSFWCGYLGAILRLLVTVVPVYVTARGPFVDYIEFVPSELSAKASSSDLQSSLDGAIATDLGKKKKKEGVLLKIKIKKDVMAGVHSDDLMNLFVKVGTGTGLRAEAVFQPL